MSNPLELSLADSFTKERFTRAINETNDVETLRKLATLMLQGWLTQKAATQWVMRQALNRPATVAAEAVPAFGFQPDQQI